MAKRGRKRKEGVERYTNGRIKPQKNTIAPTLAFRMLENSKKGASDPRLATQLGRLLLYEQISAAEYSAGCKFAEIYGRCAYYDKTRRTPKSPSYEAGFRQATKDSDLDVHVLANCKESAEASRDEPTPYEVSAMRADQAFRALRALWPERQRYILERLCVDDEAIGPTALPIARDMLQRLILHFGVEKAPPRKAKRYGNGNGTNGFAKATSVPLIGPKLKTPAEREHFITVLQRSLPDLSLDLLGDLWVNFCALRDRETYRSHRGYALGAL